MRPSGPADHPRAPRGPRLSGALAVALLTPAILIGAAAGAGATGATTYTPGVPQLATVTNGTTAAPWNTSQGDPAGAAYASQTPGTVLPVYTPGGATTAGSPNLAVYPGATSGTAGNSPYPSGVVGTPGPLDGYCGTGNYTTEAAGSPVRQPNGTTLPLAPAYFPHIVRNSDGSLTGYFDYRPKDTDEAIEVAKSTDNGKDWTYQGEALEQNAGYCPVGDVNDDGQGHPQVLTIGGVTRLYTLQRAAGDSIGVGMTVHTLTPTATNPLNGAPASEKVGIDPDAFATSAVAVNSGGVTIPVTSTGTAGSPNLLLAGGFVDLTVTPTPTKASVITCTGVTATSLTGCTNAAGVTVSTGDLIEQVIGTVSTAAVVPVGPNKTDGSGGLAALNVAFVNPQIGTLFNTNAPNRAYLDGQAIYCVQANANPTTQMQNCTTPAGTASVSGAVGDPITSDPIIPAGAQQTTGLVGPDGIVDVLPSYPGVPSGATAVLYTQKYAGYYVAGTTTNSAAVTFGSSAFSVAFSPSPYESMDMPASVSAASPVTVSIGDITNSSIVPVTCTGLTNAATDTLTGCTVPAANASDQYNKTSLVGAPGATTVPNTTLALTGQGAGAGTVSAKNIAKLFKNNEDYTVLRVAYTTDGLNFSTTGLANGGIISGASNGASSYSDISNPGAAASPANLNDPNALSTNEMRFIGSAGTVITNADGSYGLFLSGSWAADGDSDAYNRIIYATSTDGEHWSVPTTVVSTDYTFADSVAQVNDPSKPLGIGAYFSGRAYGPSVVSNPDGSLTMVFAGYRLPKVVANVGTSLGTNSSAPYTVSANDPALYRNILVETLTPSTAAGTSLPEAPWAALLPLVGIGAAGALVAARRRSRV